MSSAPMTTVPEELKPCPACDGTGQDLENVNPVTFGPTDCLVCKGTGRAAISPPIDAGHPDDTAVDRFSDAMKRKLEQKRQEGRGGWEDKSQCSAEFLSQLLREHVEKGDPVDVANLAMMLHQRGERIV